VAPREEAVAARRGADFPRLLNKQLNVLILIGVAIGVALFIYLATLLAFAVWLATFLVALGGVVVTTYLLSPQDLGGILKIVVGLAISLGLIGYLLATIDLSMLAAQLQRTAWGWVALAVILTPVGLWARAVRWRYLFPEDSNPPGLVAATMIGYMVNNVLPLRAGEVARVYVVAHRWRRGFWTTLGTVVVERVLDGITVVLLVGVSILVIPVPGYLRWGALIMLVVNLVGIAALMGMAWRPDAMHGLARWVFRHWPRLQTLVTRVFDRFVQGVHGIRTPSHIVPLLLWTVTVWVIPAFGAWTVLRALHLSLPWVAPWVVLAFVGVSVSIPSAPGFIGVFHAAAAVALGMLGVARAEAVGYALILHAVQFIPVTLIGWIFLLREHVTLAEVGRVRAESSA
jgi:glycosyltransferase 2 family protein